MGAYFFTVSVTLHLYWHCHNTCEELFSDSEHVEDGRVSPEIPIQQSTSLTLCPRWCYEEGLVKRPKTRVTVAESEESEEDDSEHRKGRHFCKVKDAVQESQGHSPEGSIREIKLLLQAVSKKVDCNERCLKEIQEARCVCVRARAHSFNSRIILC